jgi:hypothetical protein
VRKWLILALTLAWLAWELIAAYDGSPDTWPLTHLVIKYLPPWIYFPAAVLLAAFLVWHFWPTGRSGRHIRRTIMSGWTFEPVRWLSIIVGLLVALEGVQEFVDLLPERVNGWVLILIAVGTAVLGKLARDKVTPLARPRDEDGRPLVRATPPRV